MAIQRERAWRLFAGEFQDASLEHKGEGEYAPGYVITPLGARVNRVFFVGVLTSCDPVGDTGEMYRAKVTDPTGVYDVFAGQYQPEAAAALAELRPPAVVAVVGKSRTYEPEPGVVYTSIRPETIREVTKEERDAWILEAAKQTLARYQAMREARKLENPDRAAVEKLVGDAALADGIVRAIEGYPDADVGRYADMLKDAVAYLLPENERPEPSFQRATRAPRARRAVAVAAGGGGSSVAEEQVVADGPEAPAAADAEVEKRVYEIIAKLDDGKGAAWESIVTEAQGAGITEEHVEESLNGLMDKGQIFEPVLGRLRVA